MAFAHRQKLVGFLFTVPFLVGFIFLFAVPFYQAVVISFSDLVLTPETFELQWKGWANYGYALQVHPEFSKTFTEVLVKLTTELPMIIGFSFFAATILNSDFRGRTFVRTLFFLPVILSAGVVLKMEMKDYAQIMVTHLQQSAPFFGGAAVQSFFDAARFPAGMVDYVVDAIQALPTVIRASGVQILIFLAGLQSIPREVYEAASVEGATGWERFWLITFPMMGPLILVNIIYTIIDSFTAMNNKLVDLIRETMLRGAGYGVSMAMAMIYFAAIGLVLLAVFGLLSRRVFYHV